MDRIELTFLGTASAFPTPNRGVSCTALQHDDGVWLFDCGEGSQIQLMKSQLKAGKISKVFITHLHGDHLYGLPGLLCTISQSNQRDFPVEIYGPLGLRHYLCTSLAHSRSDLQFNFRVIEMEPLPVQNPPNLEEWPLETFPTIPYVPNEIEGAVVKPDDNQVWHLDSWDGPFSPIAGGLKTGGAAFDITIHALKKGGKPKSFNFYSTLGMGTFRYSDSKLTVKAVWVDHRVPSFAFVVDEAEKPGKLNAAKLKELGLPPGPDYARLKAGEAIQLKDGSMVKPEDVMAAPVEGRRVVIGGDSRDSSQLTKVAHNASVLVHEATLENGMEETCVMNGHSTPAMTAKLAQTLNVGMLILTHFSQRYRPLGAELKEGDACVQILLDEACEILPAGRVCLAQDLMVYSVTR